MPKKYSKVLQTIKPPSSTIETSDVNDKIESKPTATIEITKTTSKITKLFTKSHRTNSTTTPSIIVAKDRLDDFLRKEVQIDVFTLVLWSSVALVCLVIIFCLSCCIYYCLRQNRAKIQNDQLQQQQQFLIKTIMEKLTYSTPSFARSNIWHNYVKPMISRHDNRFMLSRIRKIAPTSSWFQPRIRIKSTHEERSRKSRTSTRSNRYRSVSRTNKSRKNTETTRTTERSLTRTKKV